MNEREHVLNAILLSVGLGVILQPTPDLAMLGSIALVTPPVFLGALLPDADTSIGDHRKTLHNLPVLAIVFAFPRIVGNLQLVWVGVLTHYVLDMLGTRRGMALFYPYPEEYEVPIGVRTDSEWALPMTLAVTAFELVAAFGLVYLVLPRYGITPGTPGVV